jgi:hypothetical protein
VPPNGLIGEPNFIKDQLLIVILTPVGHAPPTIAALPNIFVNSVVSIFGKFRPYFEAQVEMTIFIVLLAAARQ